MQVVGLGVQMYCTQYSMSSQTTRTYGTALRPRNSTDGKQDGTNSSRNSDSLFTTKGVRKTQERKAYGMTNEQDKLIHHIHKSKLGG